MTNLFQAERIDGKGFAAGLVERLCDEVMTIKAATGLTPRCTKPHGPPANSIRP